MARSDRNEEPWNTHRYLEAQLKTLGRPLEEIKDLIREYEQATRRVKAARSKQFAQVAHKVALAQNQREIGAILWEFAQHVLNEARIIGITARIPTEDLVDQIVDMDVGEGAEQSAEAPIEAEPEAASKEGQEGYE